MVLVFPFKFERWNIETSHYVFNWLKGLEKQLHKMLTTKSIHFSSVLFCVIGELDWSIRNIPRLINDNGNVNISIVLSLGVCAHYFGPGALRRGRLIVQDCHVNTSRARALLWCSGFYGNDLKKERIHYRNFTLLQLEKVLAKDQM